MSRFVLIATTAAGLVLSFATAGSAASVSQAATSALSQQPAGVTHVDYAWQGRHYHHRRWDRRRRRWEYY